MAPKRGFCPHGAIKKMSNGPMKKSFDCGIKDTLFFIYYIYIILYFIIIIIIIIIIRLIKGVCSIEIDLGWGHGAINFTKTPSRM